MLTVNNKTSEIFIYDTIGEDWFGGGVTAKAVIDALDMLDGKRALVRINSPGGIADEGIAIYNALKRYDGGVDTVVDSLAASAASVIALAGETRTTSAGGRWMIHRAMGLAIGNAPEMTKTAEILAKYDQSLVQIYSEYMPAGTDIMALLAAETWYTAEEAIAAGLSTGKAQDAADAKPVNARWFKNAPQNLFEMPKQIAASFRPKVTTSFQFGSR